MSLTPRKCGTANLALHWERRLHFNQGYWGGVRPRKAGLRLLKTRLIRHVKGSWAAARPNTQNFSQFAFHPDLPRLAAPHRHSDTDGTLRKADTLLRKQNTWSISKQHVAFVVKHSPHFSFRYFPPLLQCLRS